MDDLGVPPFMEISVFVAEIRTSLVVVIDIDQLSYRKRGPYIVSLVPATNWVGEASEDPRRIWILGRDHM